MRPGILQTAVLQTGLWRWETEADTFIILEEQAHSQTKLPEGAKSFAVKFTRQGTGQQRW